MRAANYALYIIFSMVLCDFGHNHVTVSRVAPDNLKNLIHNPISLQSIKETKFKSINEKPCLIIAIIKVTRDI